jgi:hypothetical protein
MAPSAIPLDQYREVITENYLGGVDAEDLALLLLEKYQVEVSVRTIQRRLQDWGVKKLVRVVYSQELRLAIISLYFEFRANDVVMLHILHSRGFKIAECSLYRLRRSMGLKRRVSVFQREESDDELRRVVEEELDNGQIEAYGRTLLDSHFPSHGFNFARCGLY